MGDLWHALGPQDFTSCGGLFKVASPPSAEDPADAPEPSSPPPTPASSAQPSEEAALDPPNPGSETQQVSCCQPVAAVLRASAACQARLELQNARTAAEPCAAQNHEQTTGAQQRLAPSLALKTKLAAVWTSLACLLAPAHVYFVMPQSCTDQQLPFQEDSTLPPGTSPGQHQSPSGAAPAEAASAASSEEGPASVPDGPEELRAALPELPVSKVGGLTKAS